MLIKNQNIYIILKNIKQNISQKLTHSLSIIEKQFLLLCFLYLFSRTFDYIRYKYKGCVRVVEGNQGKIIMLSLQQQPLPSDETFQKPYERAKSSYENLSKSFIAPAVTARTYGVQYSQLYFTRLALMKPRVIEAAEEKWSKIPNKCSRVYICICCCLNDR